MTVYRAPPPLSIPASIHTERLLSKLPFVGFSQIVTGKAVTIPYHNSPPHSLSQLFFITRYYSSRSQPSNTLLYHNSLSQLSIATLFHQLLDPNFLTQLSITTLSQFSITIHYHTYVLHLSLTTLCHNYLSQLHIAFPHHNSQAQLSSTTP